MDLDSKVARGIFGLCAAVVNAISVEDRIRAYAKTYIKGAIIGFIKEERGKRNTDSIETCLGGDISLGNKLGII